jgi:hypothetical protein
VLYHANQRQGTGAHARPAAKSRLDPQIGSSRRRAATPHVRHPHPIKVGGRPRKQEEAPGKNARLDRRRNARRLAQSKQRLIHAKIIDNQLKVSRF